MHFFIKQRPQNKVVVLIIYVNDIIVTGNNQEEIKNLRQYLASEFEIKDLGRLKYFLRIKVTYSRIKICRLLCRLYICRLTVLH